MHFSSSNIANSTLSSVPFRESLLQRSAFITFSLILFDISCLLYVNMLNKYTLQFFLAFATLLLVSNRITKLESN